MKQAELVGTVAEHIDAINAGDIAARSPRSPKMPMSTTITESSPDN
jgi:hypothetical protein